MIQLSAVDQWQAIEELVNNLVTTGKIEPEHREAVTAALRKRETSMSTGIGLGFALPHASTPLVRDVVFAVGCSERGVEFAAPDGEPVHTVVLFLVPAGNSVKHLNTLANIAKAVQKPYFLQALKDAKGDEEVMRLLGQA